MRRVRQSHTAVHRTRTSQPYGWDAAIRGTVSHFYCKTHDYDYYSQGWYAPDGRYFEEGYYDENGQHYENMIMTGGTTMLKCDYCGNRMVYKWKEGDLPVCDKCGAQFRIDITDKAADTDGLAGAGDGNADRNGSGPSISRAGKIIITVFIACVVLPLSVIFSAFFVKFYGFKGATGSRQKTEAVKNSIYVEEIGRTCYLDGEDWYDSKTECWFYFNDTASPYQWQYWYEGISSDYGDYGWMEYDMGEEAWYIETDNGNWVHLPSNYDTSKLWHMTDEYVNAYE